VSDEPDTEALMKCDSLARVAEQFAARSQWRLEVGSAFSFALPAHADVGRRDLSTQAYVAQANNGTRQGNGIARVAGPLATRDHRTSPPGDDQRRATS
jgi:hypothetical protein